MLAIKNNLMAENAARHLGRSYDSLSKSVERLASGLRINSAKDDAAGLAVRELVRADIATLRQGGRNARDAISMLQTAEGAMGNIDEILIRMKELAEQAATDSYSSAQRTIMDAEFQQLATEITRVAESTTFNGNALLNSSTALSIHVGSTSTIDITPEVMTAAGLSIGGGSKASYTNNMATATPAATWYTQGAAVATGTFQFGAEAAVAVDFTADETLSMNDIASRINVASQTANTYNMASVTYDSGTNMYSLKLTAKATGDIAMTLTETTGSLADVMDAVGDFGKSDGSAGGSTLITTTANAITALTTLGTAINTKDTYRAKLGYMMNRLESASSVLDIQSENLMAAESRISDVDVATEMANMTRTQVLAQAGIAMLGQANSMPQMALQLLRG